MGRSLSRLNRGRGGGERNRLAVSDREPLRERGHGGLERPERALLVAVIDLRAERLLELGGGEGARLHRARDREAREVAAHRHPRGRLLVRALVGGLEGGAGIVLERILRKEED